MRLALPAVAATIAAVAAVAAAAAPRAPVRLDGTIFLRAVVVERDCVFADAGPDARVQECSQEGRYVATRRRGVSSYAWHWHLELGSDGAPTGRADEDGQLVVRFGSRGLVRLRTQGRRLPLGTQSTERSMARTRGSWTYVSGTGAFARRRGSGTFRFAADARGATMTARLVLRGSLR